MACIKSLFLPLETNFEKDRMHTYKDFSSIDYLSTKYMKILVSSYQWYLPIIDLFKSNLQMQITIIYFEVIVKVIIGIC